MKQQTKSSNITVGLDLGDRRHRFCALDERGEVVEQDSICNDRVSLRKLAGRYHGALGVMERERIVRGSVDFWKHLAGG